MSKPITEISSKELLEIIKQNPANFGGQTITIINNDIFDFISVYKLTNGENKVSARLLYKLYKQWSKDPLTKLKFAYEMTDLFEYYTNCHGNMYLLNQSAISLKQLLNEIKPEKRLKVNQKRWGEHFQKFLNKYNIKKGSFLIKDVVLYNIYDKWAYKNKLKSQLTLNQFRKFCKVFFDSTKKGYFSVDNSVKNYLSENLLKLNK